MSARALVRRMYAWNLRACSTCSAVVVAHAVSMPASERWRAVLSGPGRRASERRRLPRYDARQG